MRPILRAPDTGASLSNARCEAASFCVCALVISVPRAPPLFHPSGVTEAVPSAALFSQPFAVPCVLAWNAYVYSSLQLALVWFISAFS